MERKNANLSSYLKFRSLECFLLIERKPANFNASEMESMFD